MLRLLASLADMVATAIDNARLFELAEQRAEEMSFLFNVTTAAAASPDLEESLQQAVGTLRDTMRVDSASVFLPDESGQFLLKGAAVGSPSTGNWLRPGCRSIAVLSVGWHGIKKPS